MRILRYALVGLIGCAVLGIDVGESVRTATITDGVAHAKHRKHHKRRHKRHKKHHAPPATEM